MVECSITLKHLRSKKSHVSTTNRRVSDLGVESTDGNEHDCAHESAENVLNDDCKQVRSRGAACWEGRNHELCEDGGRQSADESPTPYSDRLVFFAPHSCVVSKCNLEGEVDQDSEREIFLAESLVEKFEVRDGVVRLETDFSDEVDDDEDRPRFRAEADENTEARRTILREIKTKLMEYGKPVRTRGIRVILT